MANIQPYVIINGVNSRTITGLIISKLPPITKAPKRVLQEAIDGRDGDIITELGYSAYDRPLEIGLAGAFNIDQVIEFFNSSGVVIFSDEPDKYYNFTIFEGIDFNKLLRFKTASVVFHVQPYKFKVDETPLTPTMSTSPNSVTITNAGNVSASPIIEITGSGDVTLNLNGADLLEIALDALGEKIIIDTESMNAYATDGAFLNRQVAGDYDKIKLNKGANTLTLTGTVTALKITKYSRWI